MKELSYYMEELKCNEKLTDLQIVATLNRMGEYLKEIPFTKEVMEFLKEEDVFDLIDTDVYEVLINKNWAIFINYVDYLPLKARDFFVEILLKINSSELFKYPKYVIIMYITEMGMVSYEKFEEILIEAAISKELVGLAEVKIALQSKFAKLDEYTYESQMANIEKAIGLVCSYQKEESSDDSDGDFDSNDEFTEPEDFALAEAQNAYEQFMSEWN